MFCQGLDLEFGMCSTTRIEGGGACCFQDRREAERLLVEALMSSEDGFCLKLVSKLGQHFSAHQVSGGSVLLAT